MATCGARKKTCRECGHRFTKAEYDLWKCPECGEDRHCRIPVAHEGDRCRFHGGKSLKGVESATFKHGRRSKYLPERLAARYDEALSDPDLAALRSEIALLDVRLCELMERVGGEGAGSTWSELKDLYQDALPAMQAGDAEGMVETLEQMGAIIERGEREEAVWSEIYDLTERMAKVKKTEHQRLSAMHQMITVERAMAMIARIQKVIIEHVPDPDRKSAIVAEFRELTVD